MVISFGKATRFEIGLSVAAADRIDSFLNSCQSLLIDLGTSLIYISSLRYYLVLQPTGEPSVPSREHDLDRIISVVSGNR
jgi:hypothetical protein